LPGAITDVAQLRGQTAAYPILADEQIVAARLKGELQASGGALGITPGHVAVTVQVSPQQGSPGW
jgi:Flp pilus assembly protein CpaB